MVIIMDDEVDLLDMLGKLLGSLGYTPVLARNGREVLDLLRDTENKRDFFVAAIFDLTIPGGMGGKETVEQIRKLGFTFKFKKEFVFGSLSIRSEYACLYIVYWLLLKLIKYPKVTKPPYTSGTFQYFRL